MEIEPLYSAFLRSSGVNTDTRSLQAGQMFWALKGPNFNGNQYAKKALEMGASFVVVDEETGIRDARVLKVKDGLKNLQKLAHHHRLVWGKEIIGVCGSNGKTTTKELITRALATEMNVFSTPGNLNNHIGVPLSLLKLEAEHDIAVIEMGANHAREIDDLCYIAEPNSGLITNIGKDHLEGFGSIEKTAKANGELFDFLHHHLGTAFINTSDEWNEKLKSKIQKRHSYPGETDDVLVELEASDFYLKIKYAGEVAETRLMGKYNFNNLATALSVSAFYKIDPKKALDAVASYEPANNRSQIIKTERNTVISDAYNANPSSVLAALENLLDIKADKKTAILGDMLELGKESGKEHRELAHWAKKHRDIRFMVTGKEMEEFSKSFPEAVYFAKKEDLFAFLESEKLENEIVLLKGSRGMKLESLIPVL
jgi:UDP-N-acetylmuramoyl-tripeptide--D-alanyl-D-alanine ligase